MARFPKNKRKRTPKTILRLPDLEQSKSAVLNSLASESSQRSYDHFMPPLLCRSAMGRPHQYTNSGACLGVLVLYLNKPTVRLAKFLEIVFDLLPNGVQFAIAGNP